MKRIITILLVSLPFWGNAQIITTFAGSGLGGGGFSGDGGPATIAHISLATGVNFDKFGNCYFAIRGIERIRMVLQNDTIYTVAGSGVAGYSGDGFLATNAKINNPTAGLKTSSAARLSTIIYSSSFSPSLPSLLAADA